MIGIIFYIHIMMEGFMQTSSRISLSTLQKQYTFGATPWGSQIFIHVVLGCQHGGYICAGNDVVESGDESEHACYQLCKHTIGCQAWTFDLERSKCYLKTSSKCSKKVDNWTWGTRTCDPTKQGNIL